MKLMDDKRGWHYLPKRLRPRLRIISEDIDCPIRKLKDGWTMESLPDINGIKIDEMGVFMGRNIEKSFMLPERLLRKG